MEIRIKKETIYNLPYFLPIIFLTIFILRIPNFMIPIREVDPYGHTLRAYDIAKYGIKAVFWEQSIYSHIGGRPAMYPPLYHIILALLQKTAGVFFANFIMGAVQIFLLFFSIWFVTYKLVGKTASLLSILLLFIMPLRTDVWFIPLPASLVICLVAILSYSFFNNKKILTSIILSLIIYMHYLGSAVFFVFLCYSFLKKKEMLKSFIAPLLIFLPWIFFFLTNYAEYHTRTISSLSLIFSEISANSYNIISTPSFILFIISLLGLKKVNKKIILALPIIAMFLFWIFVSQINRLIASIFPLMCIIASGIVSKESIFTKIASFFIIVFFFHFLIFPSSNADLFKGSFSELGRQGYYNNSIKIGHYMQEPAKVIKLITKENEIVYTEEHFSSPLIAVFSERKITSGWAEDWIPKNLTNPYQRVNYFKNEENIPKEFKIVYSSPYGYVAVNESYLPS